MYRAAARITKIAKTSIILLLFHAYGFDKASKDSDDNVDASEQARPSMSCTRLAVSTHRRSLDTQQCTSSSILTCDGVTNSRAKNKSGNRHSKIQKSHHNSSQFSLQSSSISSSTVGSSSHFGFQYSRQLGGLNSLSYSSSLAPTRIQMPTSYSSQMGHFRR